MLVPASQPSTICKNCQKQNVIVNSEINRKEANLQIPAKLNAPIKFASPERVKLAIQHHRLKFKQLKSRIEEMQTALEKYSENVTPELNNDFITIYSGIEQNNIPPFMKLFWEEQHKYLKSSSSSSIRYHPMIIKFCLNLAAKSSTVL